VDGADKADVIEVVSVDGTHTILHRSEPKPVAEKP